MEKGTTLYKTFIWEIWIIFFKIGETQELHLTDDEIAKVWQEARFGNLGRVIVSLLMNVWLLPSYLLMKRAQEKARENGSTH